MIMFLSTLGSLLVDVHVDGEQLEEEFQVTGPAQAVHLIPEVLELGVEHFDGHVSSPSPRSPSCGC